MLIKPGVTIWTMSINVSAPKIWTKRRKNDISLKTFLRVLNPLLTNQKQIANRQFIDQD